MLLLLVAGVAGILSNYPLVFFQLHPHPAQVGLWLGTNLVLLAVFVVLGAWGAPKGGLGGAAFALSREGLPGALGLGGSESPGSRRSPPYSVTWIS